MIHFTVWTNSYIISKNIVSALLISFIVIYLSELSINEKCLIFVVRKKNLTMNIFLSNFFFKWTLEGTLSHSKEMHIYIVSANGLVLPQPLPSSHCFPPHARRSLAGRPSSVSSSLSPEIYDYRTLKQVITESSTVIRV